MVSGPDEIRSHIRRLEELPPLPQNTRRLLDVLSDEDVNLEEVARVIEEVPPLAARVVGLSRSAFFGNAGEVRSVSDAIIRVLGLRLVRNLALGITLSGSFDGDRCPVFSCEQYWASALLTGSMSRMLAQVAHTKERVDPEGAYLGGLLHNLGLLALVHVSPDEMCKVLTAASEDPGRPLTEIELEHLGTHHCQAGAWLAFRWQLPEEVGVVIENHHRADYRGDYWPLSLVVGLAVRWGRQRLAGVAEPWVAPEEPKSLGIADDDFQDCAEKCESMLGEVEELTKLLTSGQ